MKPFFSLLLAFCVSPSGSAQDYAQLRERMVQEQIIARGVKHRATLNAMLQVERHLFVPSRLQQYAYDDRPLPIGSGQTISQPFIVAYMTELLALKASDRVLEIGAGSGYQAAVLAEIVDRVYTIEIVKALGEQTKKRLRELNYNNIELIIGDGYQGLKAKAPFDAIMVTAAAEEIPPPLIDQLKEGGKMIMPVGGASAVQRLILVEKKNGKIFKTNFSEVRFVPFTRKKPE